MANQVDIFIKKNRHQHIFSKKNVNGDYFFIEQRTLPKQSLQLGILASILQKDKNLQPVALKAAPTESSEKLFKFFEIKTQINVSLRKSYLNLFTLISSILGAFMDITRFIYKGRRFENFIKNYTIKDIHLGDLIFDKFIRSNNRFIKPERKLLSLLIELIRAHYLLKTQIKAFNKYHPKLVVLTSRTYATVGGVMSRIALYRNIPTWVVSPNIMYKLYNYQDAYKNEIHYKKEDFFTNFPKNWMEAVDIYLEKRFTGDIDHHDVKNAFGEKSNSSANKSLIKLRSKNKLPIVVIFSHAFSDANHFDGGMIYNTYYDWLIETLKLVKLNKNCFWALKPHPSSELYNEGIELYEKILNDLNLNKGVFLIKDSGNTKSILDLASAVVTCRGTVSLEASSLGIPCITAARPHYGEFNINCRASTKKEYQNLIMKAHCLEKPTLHQIELAKRIVFKYLISRTSHSSKIVPDENMKPNLGRKLIEAHFDEFFQIVNNNLNHTSLETDPFYEKLLKYCEKL